MVQPPELVPGGPFLGLDVVQEPTTLPVLVTSASRTNPLRTPKINVTFRPLAGIVVGGTDKVWPALGHDEFLI